MLKVAWIGRRVVAVRFIFAMGMGQIKFQYSKWLSERWMLF